MYKEWNYKPVGLVSYGGLSGGTRSAQVCKEVITTVKMMPLSVAVSLPFFEKHIQNEQFIGYEEANKSAENLLKELLKWTQALKPLRAK